MAMLDVIKKISDQTEKANMPTMFMFGVVASIDPLSIRVDNRFTISEESIIVMRDLQAGAHASHTHTIKAHSHTVPQHSTESATAGGDSHSHSVDSVETGETELTTETETNIGLQTGDKVVLLRNYGGQSFLVLGVL